MARRFVVLGAVLLAVGAAVAGRSAFFYATSTGTTGTVVAFESIPTGHHAWRVRYEVGGQTFEILTGSYSGEKSAGNTELREGQAVSVRYRPAAPAEGRVYDIREQLGPAALFAIPGLGLLLYGLFPQNATAGPLAGKRKSRR